MTWEKPREPNATVFARLSRTEDTGRPPRFSPPLLLWGEKDELRINPKHWAAWPARLLYLLVAPIIIAMNIASIAYSWWRSRKERAHLRRKGLL